MQSLFARIEGIGAPVTSRIAGVGRISLFLFEAVTHIFTPPLKPSRIMQQLYYIGVKSLFVVILVGLFTGMVLGLQGYKTLASFGSEGLLGAAVARSLVMELGPVLAALMVTGRAGASMAAELGIMRISEQIDALDTMDINPIKYLISPRLLAAVLCMPLLTAIFDVIGIFGGYLVGVGLLGVDPGIYLHSMASAIDFADVRAGMIKPLAFGFLIAGICCYQGYHCHFSGGQSAKGVGLATTNAVVMTSVSILIVDYILTSFLF